VADPQFPMLSGETLLDSLRANRTQGARAVGGRLYLTDHRLVFLPHRFDAGTGGEQWNVLLSAVSLVDVAPRGSSLFDGSLRLRLRVTTMDGVEHFVVSKVEAVVARILKARGA
jgi:hypothetical protein